MIPICCQADLGEPHENTSSFGDSSTADKFSAEDKEALESKVVDTTTALDTMKSASKEELEELQKELS